ncbi:MAG: thymidine phosphorylase family protein [Rhodospirillaceae bacterium]
MLKVKRVPIETFGENVVFLSDQCQSYQPEAFKGMNKAYVGTSERKVMAAVNLVHGDHLLRGDEIGLSTNTFVELGLEEGTAVDLVPTTPPASMDHVRSKVYGRSLCREELDAIIHDIAGHRYSRMEITAFLMACASFMTTQEVLDLTLAMAGVGSRMDWQQDIIVDKHCIGGIPGNRTSMIVVPIVAAYGLPIPKTSSRAITSPAGTADTMEVLANVDVGIDRLIEMVGEVYGCLAWGGHVNLSPADDILISVERPLAIDTPEQMVASILSKKIAAGSTHLLIDMPVGPTAKIRSRGEAIRLRKLFEYVAKKAGLHLDVVITDGSQPIGRGIGPFLEARDVMAVLRCEDGAPTDLRERAVLLAGHILEFDPKLRGGEGFERARSLLDSGEALEAMKRIIAYQGPPPSKYALGNLHHAVTATASGKIESIDCFRIARIARLAGAPGFKGAGLDLHKRVGDQVERGEGLYTVYSALETDFVHAKAMAEDDTGYALHHV